MRLRAICGADCEFVLCEGSSKGLVACELRERRHRVRCRRAKAPCRREANRRCVERWRALSDFKWEQRSQLRASYPPVWELHRGGAALSGQAVAHPPCPCTPSSHSTHTQLSQPDVARRPLTQECKEPVRHTLGRQTSRPSSPRFCCRLAICPPPHLAPPTDQLPSLVPAELRHGLDRDSHGGQLRPRRAGWCGRVGRGSVSSLSSFSCSLLVPSPRHLLCRRPSHPPCLPQTTSRD